jgi:hypothetical protein
MTEIVIAVFRSARSAQLAVDDLNAARVQSASVRQFARHSDLPDDLLKIRPNAPMPGDRVVAVTVDERHADLVMDIVGMQSPVSMTEAPLTASPR